MLKININSKPSRWYTFYYGRGLYSDTVNGRISAGLEKTFKEKGIFNNEYEKGDWVLPPEFC